MTLSFLIRTNVPCPGPYPRSVPRHPRRHRPWTGLPGCRVRYASTMATMTRVLDPEPVRNLEAYRSAGGGRGLEAARKLGPADTIAEIEASGLRGRGGAGFPTASK